MAYPNQCGPMNGPMYEPMHGLYGPRYYRGGGIYWTDILPDIQSRESIETNCPNCKLRVFTDTAKGLAGGNICCWVISMFACFCCCFPDKWKGVVHYCPNCKISIGIWR